MAFKFNLPNLHLGDILTEGGGAFGPTSFEGYPIDAAFTLHRMGSHPPTEEQQAKMLKSLVTPGAKDAMGIAYTVSLWCKFLVTNVLEPADWDSPDSTFEHTWSLGGKSAQLWYVCDRPDLTLPKGLKGGFKHQELLATGWYETPDGKHVLWLDGDDLSVYRGRWFGGIPTVAETKRKLNTNSGFAKMCLESAPVVAAVDPGLVSSRTEIDEKTKEAKVVQFLDYWLPAPGEVDDDGDPVPYGADYFKGLAGIWDTKPVGSFTRKGEKEPAIQKVLCLTTFTGRVSVSSVVTAQTGAQGAADAKKGTSKAGAPVGPAITEAAVAPVATPAVAATATTAASTTSASASDSSLEARIKSAILQHLPTEIDPTTGRHKAIPAHGDGGLELAMFKAGLAAKTFTAKEVTGGGSALYRQILAAAPGPDDAAIIGAPDGFVYNAAQKVVERWATE